MQVATSWRNILFSPCLRGLSVSLALLIWQPIAVAADNSAFSFGLAGVHPVLWGDFEPLKKNMSSCIADSKMTTPICLKVQEAIAVQLSDALLHAVMVNATAKGTETRFCDAYSLELVKKQRQGDQAAYALLLIEEQIKYGSALYGKDLPGTYLAKLTFDALVNQSPCKK